MAQRAKRPCNKPGCPNLTSDRYCADHIKLKGEDDRQRGSAHQRGYTYRWAQYSKRFLSKEENQLCKLRLDDGCKFVAECVDHIVAVKGASDPLFWEPSNHQASCLHCNTVKGKRTIEGSDWDGDYNTASNRNTEKHNKKDGLGY